ncbi:GATA zinc finger domain-containing protein 7-like [Rhagoletis pomonella]|uniref:GATA zinc finger domain-containing protein 7-like n=1 Tax=Rhagoletis pomonella TaxID=28610 RepID=UPI001781CB7B|nr:GATA zinc finger domain-containing protein 7-like [Rhagoletis pomonella]
MKTNKCRCSCLDTCGELRRTCEHLHQQQQTRGIVVSLTLLAKRLSVADTTFQLQTSTSSSYSSQANNFSNNYNNNNNNNNGQGNNFGRQQAYRSSFYGTRYQSNINSSSNNTNNNNYNNTYQVNGDANGNSHSNSNGSDKRFTSIVTTSTIKPLTPKLVRRIETTCSNGGNCGGGGGGSNGVTHNKPRAPLPPATNTSTSALPSGNKQYLRTRNQLAPPPPARNPSNFERFHNSNLSFRQKNSGTCSGASAGAGASTGTIAAKSTPAATNCNGGGSQTPAPAPSHSKYSGATFYNSSSTRSSGGAGSQKRAYCTAQNVHKENVPVRSVKNYPAPLPPSTPKAVTKKKYREDLKLAIVSASPNIHNRRLGGVAHGEQNKALLSASQRRKNYVPFNNGQSNCATAASKNGSTGSNESTGSGSGSSGSHGSPKTKKIFSTKFPQGLPFEDEFYRQRFCRSYSQSSSSNYSFYSSVGAPATPHSRDFDDLERGHEPHERRSAIDEDDEFQRKPASDEPLYVDFSKVMLRQSDCHTDYSNRNGYCNSSSSSSGATTTTIVPTTTWIGTTRTTNSPLPPMLAAKLASENGRLDAYAAAAASAASAASPGTAAANGSPHLRRTTKSKISHSINDYLYTSCGAATTTTTTLTTSTTKKVNGTIAFLPDDPEDGYYTHTTSPEPPAQTDIYLAVASWAPKCLHPTKVHIPASSSVADRNNNPTAAYAMMNGYDHRLYYGKTTAATRDILEPTINELQ